MRNELSKGNLSEIDCRPNIAYLLDDIAMFSGTGYKFLQTQEEYFIPCKGLMFNGKKKLVYFTENYKCIEDMIPALDAKNIFSILAMLVKSIIDIKSIGFLSCNNIDLSLEKVFWDFSTKSIRLIYLPINSSDSTSKEYEKTLKKLIVETIETKTTLPLAKSVNIRESLIDPSITLEELYRKLYEEHKVAADSKNKQNTEEKSEISTEEKEKQLVLSNVADGKKINITKGDFIIGKSVNSDGVIKDNKAVSRSHCMILINDGIYSIVDLESANGTYLNGVKLSPGEQYHINDGDKIRIANSNWVVEL